MFCTSVWTLTQVPLQFSLGVAQTHWPHRQVWSLRQLALQPPQWLESVLVSTQVPPQLSRAKPVITQRDCPIGARGVSSRSGQAGKS